MSRWSEGVSSSHRTVLIFIRIIFKGPIRPGAVIQAFHMKGASRRWAQAQLALITSQDGVEAVGAVVCWYPIDIAVVGSYAAALMPKTSGAGSHDVL
jgi:hypothetical protein